MPSYSLIIKHKRSGRIESKEIFSPNAADAEKTVPRGYVLLDIAKGVPSSDVRNMGVPVKQGYQTPSQCAKTD